VPVAPTIWYSGSIVTSEDAGLSAIAWPMLAVFPVDASAPVAPAAACTLSALSAATAVELPPALTGLNR